MPEKTQSTPFSGQDETYQEASAAYGPAISRLVRAYEVEPDKRADLLQEIHIAFWKSLGRFNGNCSLRTWAFRIAHNVAASHVLRERRRNRVRLVGLEELDDGLGAPDSLQAIAEHQAVARLTHLIRQLIPIDRQVILSYLEGIRLCQSSIRMLMWVASSLVVLRNFHILGAILAKNKAESPLLVDADAVLAPTISCERLEAVARRYPQIFQAHRRTGTACASASSSPRAGTRWTSRRACCKWRG